MGRHRTSRAKEKFVRNPNMHVSCKRNRDLALKQKRVSYQKGVTEKARSNKVFMDAAFPSLAPKKGDLERVGKKINENYIERVKLAQSSYDSLIETADKTQALIEILDARDPFSFRFLDIEGETRTQNKPLIFIINKVDLVPANEIAQWIIALSATAPTIAVSLSNPESCIDLINATLTEHAASAEKIAVVGAAGVGKTTLVNMIGGERLVDTEQWLWTLCGNSLGLTNSVPWKGRIREFAVNTMERVVNDVIFELLNSKKDESIGNIFAAYAKKNGVSKQDVPEIIINHFINNDWKWFSKAPEVTEEVNVSELQKKALEACNNNEEIKYIILGQGVSVQMDRKTLEFEIPQNESDSENEEAHRNDEEEEEEANEQ